jgi:hypothetical protein
MFSAIIQYFFNKKEIEKQNKILERKKFEELVDRLERVAKEEEEEINRRYLRDKPAAKNDVELAWNCQKIEGNQIDLISG